MILRRVSFLWFGVLLALTPVTTQAQEGQFEPVPMAWADLFPWFYRDSAGELTGFAVDLIEEIGTAVDFEVEAFDVQTYSDWGQAQASGTSAVLPAVAKLPGLVATNVFSNPVLTTEVRLAIPVESIDTFDPSNLSDVAIGVLSQRAGSDPSSLPGANLVEYPNLDTALMGMFGGEVEAISADAAFVFSETYRARLDQHIAFVGPALQSVERFIAIHQSREELLEPVNAELERMRSDGRLDALFAKHNVIPPKPPPDVLRVGVFELKPYMMLDADGAASGFAIDVLKDVARIAGLDVEFVPIAMQALVPGDSHDVLPVISKTPERANAMDFTYPIETSEFSIFTRTEDAESFSDLASLADTRVGVFSVSLAKDLAEKENLKTLVEFGDDTDIESILRSLDAGDIDAFLFERTSVNQILRQANLDQSIVEVTPPFATTQRSIALRFGLGTVRNRLNTVLPEYVVSDQYEALRQAYFGEPVYWTTTRLYWVAGFVGAALTAIFFVGTGFQMRSLRRVASAERSAARLNAVAANQGKELEVIFNAATSGIIAVDLKGKVVRANNAARHMLGGLSQPTPFEWPEDIKFVDAETMSPLDNSADPLKRALSGNQLHKETHLINRLGAGDDRRYVRMDSAKLEMEGEELLVLVIDDVSNEERNRQVVERKSRLDALGQLTGGIAHDFNNLLTSLLYSIVLARRTNDAVSRVEHLQEAETSINRGRSLTSRLLAFASKQPGLAEARSTSKVLNDFDKLMRPMLEASITLSLEIEDPSLIVYCDQTQLESAMMNLVLNSRDAILLSGKGNRITLKARAVAAPAGNKDETPVDTRAFRFVEISVTDNGPGMNEETLARATDPFFTTKDTNSGTGLGLAMVYGFARQSSGDFRIYSEFGIGTTVQLTLPRGTQSGNREGPTEDQDIIPGSGQTILLVEDEMQILTVASKLLKDIGYNVVTATSGKEALERLDAGDYFDLLLTDVVMPGEVGGFELARRVKLARPNVPVLYVSGYTGFTSNEMGEVVAPLLQKPTPPAELSRALSLALASTE